MKREKVEDMELPRFYRWLLKIPLPNFFRSNRFPMLAGFLFYGLLPTIFMAFAWLILWVIMLYTYPIVGFPLNIILALIIPAAISLFWARIQIENALNRWKTLQSPPPSRNLEETVKEYFELINKQRRKQK